MVKLIMAAAGSGKTKDIINQVNESAANAMSVEIDDDLPF